MTRTENEAIEIFCRLLALEIRQITGRTIDSLPERWGVPGENDPQQNEVQTPPGDHNDLYPFILSSS